ncbi:hypothetical protein BSZ32_00045 [Rubritalea profundi]|uniref:Type II secretion system protein GspG C-terminal domain-containing protein n=2 Tax=Rubritalea profundi TaxID=1658618 RepID=A0A2S7TWC7_9BACT|nr:hypothetical protein BSZ32_00045 [Rubritalea profundi]
MRCFLIILALIGSFTFQSICAEKKLTNYMQNKLALERTVKMYLAFEARHDVEPGIESDLNLPEKAKFQKFTGEFKAWVYPIALGLEVKIGSPQRRIVVIAPASANGRYLIGTDDLVVKSYTKSELKRVFEALEKRREKLSMKPLD